MSYFVVICPNPQATKKALLNLFGIKDTSDHPFLPDVKCQDIFVCV